MDGRIVSNVSAITLGVTYLAVVIVVVVIVFNVAASVVLVKLALVARVIGSIVANVAAGFLLVHVVVVVVVAGCCIGLCALNLGQLALAPQLARNALKELNDSCPENSRALARRL